MKVQRIKPRGRLPEDVAQEYIDLGYQAEVDGDEVVVYYGVQHKPKKVHKNPEQAERWSKRERNFGHARGVR